LKVDFVYWSCICLPSLLCAWQSRVELVRFCATTQRRTCSGSGSNRNRRHSLLTNHALGFPRPGISFSFLNGCVVACASSQRVSSRADQKIVDFLYFCFIVTSTRLIQMAARLIICWWMEVEIGCQCHFEHAVRLRQLLTPRLASKQILASVSDLMMSSTKLLPQTLAIASLFQYLRL
jgi:hypothetical protein